MEKTDILIIGAGPIGLFTAFQAGMLGLKTALIETLDFVGGQCSALYPKKPIYDIPGFPVVTAQELIARLREQAQPFRPLFILGDTVISVAHEANGIVVSTLNCRTITTKVLIIAAGGGAFGPNRPPIPSIEEFEGKSVFYNVMDHELFRNKRVVIAGGGDSAIDWANIIADIASIVYLVHRRGTFKAIPDSTTKMLEKAAEGKIELITPYQLSAISGSNGHLTHVEVSDLDGNKRSIEADILLPFFGLSMNLGPIAEWGLNLNKNHIEVDPSTMRTNAENIYAIGDIATYKGKLKLILTGFSEAAIACHSAYSMIYPDKPLHFEYSTTKGIPKA